MDLYSIKIVRDRDQETILEIKSDHSTVSKILKACSLKPNTKTLS